MQGAGRYAVLKDPQGAVFAIIDPENARPEAAGTPPLGTFSWHELATTDNEAAFAFYSGLFGWDAMQRMDMGPTGIYLIFGQNGVQRGGMYIKPADMPAPPNWLPYAHVPNADKGYALAHLERRARVAGCAHGRAGRQPHRRALRSGWRGVCDSFDAGRRGGQAPTAEGQGQGQSPRPRRKPRPSEDQGEDEGRKERLKKKAKAKKVAKKVVKKVGAEEEGAAKKAKAKKPRRRKRRPRRRKK